MVLCGSPRVLSTRLSDSLRSEGRSQRSQPARYISIRIALNQTVIGHLGTALSVKAGLGTRNFARPPFLIELVPRCAIRCLVVDKAGAGLRNVFEPIARSFIAGVDLSDSVSM